MRNLVFLKKNLRIESYSKEKRKVLESQLTLDGEDKGSYKPHGRR
jgi:hypothetical protein